MIIKLKEVYAVTKNIIQFTCTKIIGNSVKQCESLEKKLKGVNTCCFSTIPDKVCAKYKFQILKVVLALKVF